MLKDILNLNGVQILSKTEQKNIQGGGYGQAKCANGAEIESNTSVSYAEWQDTVSNFCGHQGGVVSNFFFGEPE